MEIITTLEYNKRQEEKYKQRVAEWKPEIGGFPQIAFYFFYDNKGNRRTDGFVATDGKIEILKPTVIGAKRCFNKAKRQYA